MSAASVSAYLSPTMARKRAISSGESGGVARAWTMIHRLVSCRFLASSPAARRGAAQPVVDGLAEPVMRHRHDRDGARAHGIERAKMPKRLAAASIEIAARDKLITAPPRQLPARQAGRTRAAPRRRRRRVGIEPHRLRGA